MIFICAINCFIAKAQLCQGSLGDPVVDITFGAGNNPGPPLPASTTAYQYFAADCPEDGQYTIRNSTSSCFNFTWFGLGSDHTGDPNGYFMLVNASYQPSDFFVDQIEGLCPNTTYEFAAWILNILVPYACNGQGEQPNITFTIETINGAILNSFNTGSIPSNSFAQWVQYGFYFKTPADVSEVVIRMTNNAPGGCGNDLALDDITFRPCGPQVTGYINNNPADTVNVCEGNVSTFTFNANISSGYTDPTYQWQENNGSGWTDIAGANDTTFTKQFATAGNYQYRLAVADAGNINVTNCRILSNVLEVNVHPKASDSISFSNPPCVGKSITLSVPPGSTYEWTGPNNFSSTDSSVTITDLSASNSGTYFVSVTSKYGCGSAKDSVIINAQPNPVASASNSKSICAGNGVYLNGSGGIQYSWSPANGLSSDSIANPFASPADSTVYTLTVTNQFGCIDSVSVAINILPLPMANAGADKTILEGQSVELNGTIATNVTSFFYWLPDVYIDNVLSLNPTVHPPDDTTYTLYDVSNDGCGTAADHVFVKVYKTVLVPNAFSPNGDGINDTWKITELDTYPGAEVFIFNRYGQTVFHSTNYQPWNGTFNGKTLPIGTYYYLIDLKVSILPKLSGWVEIFR